MSRLSQILTLLAESPDDPFLRFALAKEWESEGDSDEALRAWSWFPKHCPTYTGFYYHYARLLYQSGREKEARAVLADGLGTTRAQGEWHDHRELKGLEDSWEG